MYTLYTVVSISRIVTDENAGSMFNLQVKLSHARTQTMNKQNNNNNNNGNGDDNNKEYELKSPFNQNENRLSGLVFICSLIASVHKFTYKIARLG